MKNPQFITLTKEGTALKLIVNLDDVRNFNEGETKTEVEYKDGRAPKYVSETAKRIHELINPE